MKNAEAGYGENNCFAAGLRCKSPLWWHSVTVSRLGAEGKPLLAVLITTELELTVKIMKIMRHAMATFRFSSGEFIDCK